MNTTLFICFTAAFILGILLLAAKREVIGAFLIVVGFLAFSILLFNESDEKADEEKSIICSEYKIEMIEITRTTHGDTIVQYIYKIHYKE